MEFLHSRILLRILLGVASVVCFVTAVSWFRATYGMYKTGRVKPLLLPIPAFLQFDIMWSMMRRIRGQSNLPPNLEEGLDRVDFEYTVSMNYMKAVLLLIIGIVAASMVYSDMR